MEAQGLYVNICSLYWSRLGDLPEKLAIQKLCKSYANAYQELCEEQILHIQDGRIIIEFLDEQLNEVNELSEKRRASARKRWAKKDQEAPKNASAMQVHSKSNAIRKEEIRKEEIRIDNIDTRKQVFVNTINQLFLNPEFINSTKYRDEFIDYWTECNPNGKKLKFEKQKTFDPVRRLRTWIKNDFSKKSGEAEQYGDGTALGLLKNLSNLDS